MTATQFRLEVGRVLNRKTVPSTARGSGHITTIRRTREGQDYALRIAYSDTKGWQVQTGRTYSGWHHTLTKALSAWWTAITETPAYQRQQRLKAIDIATEADLSAAFAALPVEARRALLKGTV